MTEKLHTSSGTSLNVGHVSLLPPRMLILTNEIKILSQTLVYSPLAFRHVDIFWRKIYINLHLAALIMHNAWLTTPYINIYTGKHICIWTIILLWLYRIEDFWQIFKIILTWILRTVNPGNELSDLELIKWATVKRIRIFKPKINGIWKIHLAPLKGLLYT